MERSFKTRPELTPRTLAVAEAFGLGLDEAQTWPVYREYKVEVNPGDVVYITGESGGGKSLLLRELAEQMRGSPEFGRVLTDADVAVSPEEVPVEGLGATVDEALNHLSQAGLNEAFLWLRRYRELSDGQRYRYRLAKMLASGAATWLFDEFAATLDRETARIVAFSLQKTARRTGRTVVVATSHGDLFEDLNPSVYIVKRLGAEVETSRYPNTLNAECTVLRDVEIKPAAWSDYRRLEFFHYRAGRPFGVRKVFAAWLRGRLVAAIVYSLAPRLCAARNRFLGYAPSVEEVNRDFLLISRVVVHPKYRSIGLGARLVRETLPQAGSRIVEAIAVMARFNPFFAKAGMQQVAAQSSFQRGCRHLMERLQAYGFHPSLAPSEAYNLKVIAGLTEARREEVLNIIAKHPFLATGDLYARKLPHAARVRADLAADPNLLAKAVRSIAIRAQEKLYYIWRRESAEVPQKGGQGLLSASDSLGLAHGF
ncbi:MAG: ABC transporter ATP-binding protein [Candidatus Bathyarchaeia archaeon]